MQEQQLLHSRIEGKGRPLLVLHGYLGMSDNWRTLATRYAEAGFEVHALDLRNHGRSFHSEELSQELMVEDIYNYCKHYKLEKISIIGHSMGGKLAMLFAMTYPKMIDKLIIADISVRQYAPHHQDILAALNAVDFSIVKDRKDIEEVISQYLDDVGVILFLMKNVYRKSAEQYAYRMNLKVLTEKYENIGIALPSGTKYDRPVLFLRGGNSSYIRERDVQDILVHFPQAKIQTISKAGHWLHAEKPDEFFNISLNHLNS